MIESGKPKSVEDHSDKIKHQFDIKGDISLQYMDCDFNNEFVNLNQISNIQEKRTVKIICLSDVQDLNQGNMNQSGEETSLSSSDTILFSVPDP